VPEGTARLRITLSAAHTDLHIDTLVSALVETATASPAAARAA
jgi:7-keto-8-aminopelargonate synthetase-like enzyme